MGKVTASGDDRLQSSRTASAIVPVNNNEVGPRYKLRPISILQSSLMKFLWGGRPARPKIQSRFVTAYYAATGKVITNSVPCPI
jgi:hypothetical protein